MNVGFKVNMLKLWLEVEVVELLVGVELVGVGFKEKMLKLWLEVDVAELPVGVELALLVGSRGGPSLHCPCMLTCFHTTFPMAFSTYFRGQASGRWKFQWI